jgi:hypothetical protein
MKSNTKCFFGLFAVICASLALPGHAGEASVKASALPLEARQGFLKQQVAPQALADEHYFV